MSQLTDRIAAVAGATDDAEHAAAESSAALASAVAARDAALDAGDVDEAKAHGADIGRLRAVASAAVAELEALRAARLRLEEERATAEREAQYESMRLVVASTEETIVRARNRVRELLAELCGVARDLRDAETRHAHEGGQLFNLEVATGRRERALYSHRSVQEARLPDSLTGLLREIRDLKL